jgi:hypothetical protein
MAPTRITPPPGDATNRAAAPPLRAVLNSPHAPTRRKKLTLPLRPPAVKATPIPSDLAHGEQISEPDLVIDVLYDSFLARRAMLDALAELRGDEHTDLLW